MVLMLLSAFGGVYDPVTLAFSDTQLKLICSVLTRIMQLGGYARTYYVN